MALYKDGNPVSGLNSIPRLTLAQYNALNVKPEFWVRTDAPESYKKLSADQVSYDSNNTVKDKIDTIINKYENVSVTTSSSGAFVIPNNINYTRILSIVCTSRVNTVILLRGADNYCFAYDLVNGVLTPLPSTSLLVTFTYY